MPARAEREGQLGHRLGVDALAARPQPVVVDEVRRTARRRPTAAAPTRGPRRLLERGGEAVGVVGRAPHQPFGIGERTESTAAVGDGLGHPRQAPIGDQRDAGCVAYLACSRPGYLRPLPGAPFRVDQLPANVAATSLDESPSAAARRPPAPARTSVSSSIRVGGGPTSGLHHLSHRREHVDRERRLAGDADERSTRSCCRG